MVYIKHGRHVSRPLHHAHTADVRPVFMRMRAWHARIIVQSASPKLRPNVTQRSKRQRHSHHSTRLASPGPGTGHRLPSAKRGGPGDGASFGPRDTGRPGGGARHRPGSATRGGPGDGGSSGPRDTGRPGGRGIVLAPLHEAARGAGHRLGSATRGGPGGGASSGLRYTRRPGGPTAGAWQRVGTTSHSKLTATSGEREASYDAHRGVVSTSADATSPRHRRHRSLRLPAPRRPNPPTDPTD